MAKVFLVKVFLEKRMSAKGQTFTPSIGKRFFQVKVCRQPSKPSKPDLALVSNGCEIFLFK
jgi:hypothetical protein